MIVRPATAADRPAWAAMRARLWPDEDAQAHARELDSPDFPCAGLIGEEAGRPIGFLELGVRPYVEGCPGPAAYVEGVWVEPEARRRGVATALLRAAEDWARANGYTHIGSDALIDNDVSHRWHAAAGFAEVERLVAFAKPLG